MPKNSPKPWELGADALVSFAAANTAPGYVEPAMRPKTRPASAVTGANPAKIIPIVPDHRLPAAPLKSWSFSSLMDFERCKYYTFLKRVQKIPEPERPLPPGKMEHANDRGSRIHDSAEMFVRGKKPFNPELRAFETEFHAMQGMFKQGMVSLEGEWGMDENWEPADWNNAWLRLKLDALVFKSETEAVIIDYKTGRKFGNEVKHGEQVQLYQLVTFLRYPKLETAHVELWYLDQDEITSMTFHRHQGLRFRQKWDARATKMVSAVDFPPNPNMFNCKYCMYGPKGAGICEKGVL
jgi:hypothetical protein